MVLHTVWTISFEIFIIKVLLQNVWQTFHQAILIAFRAWTAFLLITAYI